MQVTVHDAASNQMSFLDKNFHYSNLPFGTFLDAITERKARLYLRSLSSTAPSGKPAMLVDDFPTIANDFRLPPELAYVTANTHSSPLRISGPVNMWLHYDVMANIYCQIQGSKRLVLFPPGRVTELQFPAGASSSRLHIFDSGGGLLPQITSFEPVTCDLNPGDVLFIPAFWPHTAHSLNTFSVAVNVFFRSMSNGYAAGQDVYGNRDLQAYETGRKNVERITRAFKDLPPDASHFYLKRLAAELDEAAQSTLA